MPTEKRQRQKEGRAARQAALQASRRRAARRRQLIGFGVVAALLIGLLAFIQSGNDDNENASTGTSTTTTTVPPEFGAAPCPNADGSSPRTTTFTDTPAQCIDRAKSYTAAIETDVGSFTIALDADKAPVTVNNFVFLARHHFFDGVKFHRVIPGFVVQGGDANKGDGTGDAGYKIADELPASVDEYKAGAVAMANSGPNTSSSQFFVVTTDEGGKGLPGPAYSLFGQVTAGLDVVQKIEADGGPAPEGTPKVVHQMNNVTILEA
jgi:cyclophilin family peptidyl-prolyl cis-trans isomerase